MTTHPEGVTTHSKGSRHGAIRAIAGAAGRKHGANDDERRDNLNNATIRIDTELQNRFKCRAHCSSAR